MIETPDNMHPMTWFSGSDAPKGSDARTASPRIVIAMDSFKGCMGSLEVAESLKQGILDALPLADVCCLPVADGGEGTVEALAHALSGTWISKMVTGPTGHPVNARYLLLPEGTAVMELASASGLPLVSRSERNPLMTTTFGTGQLMRDALDHGCKKILLGVGGSATNDAGVGLMEALGMRYLDVHGDDILFGGVAGPTDEKFSVTGGGDVGRICRIDANALDPRLRTISLLVACDVDNPLCGPQGASFTYGPQKGATPEQVEILDRNLLHYAELVRTTTGVDVQSLPGSGAAGGVNASLVPFCGAVLKPGIQWVLEAVGLRAALEGASLVITGEGRMDGQSAHGKAPVGVASVAKEKGLPVFAVVGDTGPDVEQVHALGIDSILRLRREGMSVEESMRQVRPLLLEAGRRIGQGILEKKAT